MISDCDLAGTWTRCHAGPRFSVLCVCQFRHEAIIHWADGGTRTPDVCVPTYKVGAVATEPHRHLIVHPEEFESPVSWFVVRCFLRLSYGWVFLIPLGIIPTGINRGARKRIRTPAESFEAIHALLYTIRAMIACRRGFEPLPLGLESKMLPLHQRHLWLFWWDSNSRCLACKASALVAKLQNSISNKKQQGAFAGKCLIVPPVVFETTHSSGLSRRSLPVGVRRCYWRSRRDSNSYTHFRRVRSFRLNDGTFCTSGGSRIHKHKILNLAALPICVQGHEQGFLR